MSVGQAECHHNRPSKPPPECLGGRPNADRVCKLSHIATSPDYSRVQRPEHDQPCRCPRSAHSRLPRTQAQAGAPRIFPRAFSPERQRRNWAAILQSAAAKRPADHWIGCSDFTTLSFHRAALAAIGRLFDRLPEGSCYAPSGPNPLWHPTAQHPFSADRFNAVLLETSVALWEGSGGIGRALAVRRGKGAKGVALCAWGS